MKNTKRALLTSVIALVMCITMLVGTTFAWFTDSAMSLNNKIVAGELDVELRMYNGTEYVNIGDSEDPIFGDANSIIAQDKNIDTLWEPGKTQVAYLQIVNHGTLALKYMVAIEVRNDKNDLYEVMKYQIVPNATPDAPVAAWDYDAALPVVVGTNVDAKSVDTRLEKEAVHNFALAIHMDEEAGNKYQFGEVSFDIKVLATQDTVEADYFDEFYDEDATYPVATVDELEAAIAAGEPIIALADDITVAETIAIENDLTINLQGHSLDNAKVAARALKVTADDVDLTINAEGTESTFVNGTYGVVEVAADVKNANVTVNGGKFTGTTDDGAFVRTRPGSTGTITLNNVTYIDEALADTTDSNPAVVSAQGVYDIVINGGYYKAARGVYIDDTDSTVTVKDAEFVVSLVGEFVGTATFDNCKFVVDGVRINSLYPSAAISASYAGKVTVKNTTITGKTDSVYVVYPTGGEIIAENNTVTVTGLENGTYFAYDQYSGCTATITDNGVVEVSK